MSRNRFVVPLVRALGAFQTGVAVHLLLPPGWKYLGLAAAASAGVFVAGRRLMRLTEPVEVVAAGYVGPLAAAAALHLLLAAPPTWEAAGAMLRRFVFGVYAATPAAAYLGCLAYALFAAGRKAGGGFYR